MDRLDELAILIAVIDEGSLAAAAKRLRRSPPAVTRALAALEDRLGVRLVERTTRRLSPSEQGLHLADRARLLLADYDAATQCHAAAPLRGLLRVTAPLQFGRRHVAPLVDRFLDRFPLIQCELVLHDRNLDLIEEGLDVAIRIGQLIDSGLLSRRVGEVKRLLVASPGYLARKGNPVQLADLTDHDTIFATVLSGRCEWRFESGERAVSIGLRPRLLVNEVEAVLQAARAGRGIARVLSYQVADDLAAGSLIRLMPETEPPPLPVHLVTGGGRHMAPKIRAFLTYAYDELRALRVLRGGFEPESRDHPRQDIGLQDCDDADDHDKKDTMFEGEAQ